MIEQEPEEPVIYTPPTGRRQRTDSSKLQECHLKLWGQTIRISGWNYIEESFEDTLSSSDISNVQYLIENLNLVVIHQHFSDCCIRECQSNVYNVC